MTNQGSHSEAQPASLIAGAQSGRPRDAGVCTGCGAPFLPRDRYCEACGATLPKLDVQAQTVCRSCGGPVGGDGYCGACGVRDEQPGLEHDEIDLGWIGAVTDRGRHHRINEDAMAVATEGGTVMAVVCDGVSSTPGSARASRNAADAALGVLRDTAAVARDWSDAMVDAIEAARVAASLAPASDPGNPPACTIVAAIGGPGKIVVGWLGDSRAYWLEATGGRRLTCDDSWGAECVAAGVMTADAAEADQRAHVITRWLGADAPFFAPHVIDFEPPAAGSLVLCSDGLWNYGPTPEELAREATGSAGEAARRLCAFALAGGGHDNVTVVVARLAKEVLDDLSP